MGKLVKAPKVGYTTKYECIDDCENCNQATVKSHWVLMTKAIIEGGIRKDNLNQKDYLKQQALMAEFTKKTEIHYMAPHVFRCCHLYFYALYKFWRVYLVGILHR